MKELKWMNWNAGIEVKELNRMNWNDELKERDGNGWIAKSGPRPLICPILCNQLLDYYFVDIRHGALASFSCTFCLPLSSIEGRNRGNRDCGHHGRPLYPKKYRVSRTKVFSSVNSRFPDRLHFPTTSLWCGWHDDVWLTWWWDS